MNHGTTGSSGPENARRAAVCVHTCWGLLVGGVSPASPWALPSGPLACSRTFGCSVVLASCSPRLPVSWPAAGLRGGEGTSPAVAPCLGRAPGPTHLLPCLLPASVWGHHPVLPPASAPPPMHSEQHPWPVPAFCARVLCPLLPAGFLAALIVQGPSQILDWRHPALSRRATAF